MAWKIETEEGGKTVIVINGWEKGIAPDPYSGINDMRNVNIGTVPGEVSVGFGISASTTSGATLGIPVSRATQFSVGQAVAYYILDADGQVFKSTTLAGTWTYLSSNSTLTGASNTDSIVFWKHGNSSTGYLLKTRGANIDYWDGSTWTNAWKSTLTAGVQHFALVGQDDVVYWCNNTSLASLLEIAGQTFDPTNTATYTFTTTALQLPSYEVAQSLAELGTNLLVGGSQSAIYPWNRIATSYSYPIFCADTFMRKMVTANNNVFIFPGNTTGRGRIYITNGSQIEVFHKMPDYISRFQEPYYRFYDAIFHRNSLIFGCEVGQNGTGAVINSMTHEVWAVDVTTKVFRSISTIPGGTASARVLIADQSNSSQPGYDYMLGYSNGSDNNIGYSGTAAGTGNATIISDMIPVGTFLDKRTLEQLEFKLATPLQSGESIVFSYVNDVTSGTITTFTTATTPTVGDVSPLNIDGGSQWLQIQAVLTGNSPTSGCRLREIRLR